MTTKIDLVTDRSGQVITEPCYDAELIHFRWDSDNKVIELIFRCPKDKILRITFLDVVRFRVDELATYNISTTFFITSNGIYDEKMASQYIKELFRESDVTEEAERLHLTQTIVESLKLCSTGDYVLFANDATVGGVLTILSKNLIAEFL